MRKMMVLMIIAFVAVAFMPLSASAVSKKTMTAYNQVIKSGNYVYCSASKGLYKVNVKSKKVKRLKKVDPQYDYIHSMKKKGKYIYFLQQTNGTLAYLYRTNIKTGKTNKLAAVDEGNMGSYAGYVLSKKKIYCKYVNYKKVVMKLNGKGKKRTSAKIKMKTVQTTKNAKNYKVSGNTLIFPNGKKLKLK